jgi:hypothetical protein
MQQFFNSEEMFFYARRHIEFFFPIILCHKKKRNADNNLYNFWRLSGKFILNQAEKNLRRAEEFFCFDEFLSECMRRKHFV